jgi:4,5-dihydroxyphthalate decarboxylase
VNHEIDAASGTEGASRVTNFIDRSTQIRATGGDWSKVKPLFSNLIEEGTRFYKKYRFIPATQMYTMRRSTYEKYPWAAFNLYDAFVKSKRRAEETLNDRISSLMVFGREYAAQTRSIFDGDPYPYGLEKNRSMLTTIIDYLYEQHLITMKPKVEELFAPSVVSL